MDVLKTCVASYTLVKSDCTVRNPAVAGSGIASCLAAVKDAHLAEGLAKLCFIFRRAPMLRNAAKVPENEKSPGSA